MESFQPPGPMQANSYGKTSIELAKQQTYSTVTSIGIKRSHQEINHGSPLKIRKALSERTNLQIPSSTLNNKLRASDIKPAPEIPALTVSEYTQRVTAASTPGPEQNPLLSLGHSRYGLPDALISNLDTLGIRAIYPWQSICLLGTGLLAGTKNLIYTAPTGGGKSLVADVLMLKRVIDKPKAKAILVLPYVALVQEKVKWLRRVVEGVDKKLEAVDSAAPNERFRRQDPALRVAAFLGGSRSRATWADVDVAVCTIEKANALVNAAIEEGVVGELGVVVLDELHMLDDEHRGYLMELMCAKLRSLPQYVQLIGMSATLSNTRMIADWLDAKFYISNYRPVPIEEHLVFENRIYPTANSKQFFRTASQLSSVSTQEDAVPIRVVAPSVHKELENPMANAMISLTLETVKSGYGALVFCSSRLGCQTSALLISEAMPCTDSLDATVLDRRLDLVATLQSLPSGFEPAFQKTIVRGVAFHHAGLTTEERDIVSEAYDCGLIKVMVATCSLAAGVNLPARRVIILGARMGRDLVGPAMLRQMRGRAGRKGKDEIGETYLCCQKSDLEAVANLLEAELPAVESCLTPEKRGMTRALLEVIVTRLAKSPGTVDEYVKRTLLYQTMKHADLFVMVESTMQNLLRDGLIILTDEGAYEPTLLGQAIISSALSPEDGVFVHAELQRALRAFVMDGDMHVLYSFTPVQIAGLTQISWPIFRKEVESLDDSGIRALQFVGIKPGFVNRMANSGATLKESTQSEINFARVCRRMYAAFQLRDLCNESPVHGVARKYDVPRGFVQNLSQQCQSFAAGMIKFCDRMGWGMLAAVLDLMQDRLKAGARADLLEMAQVPFVKSRMARMLWDSGLKSVRALAAASPEDVVPILMQAQPWKANSKDPEVVSKFTAKIQERANIIVGAASKIWERQMVIELEE